MDTRDINAQNLLFLLSAAPLSIGCVITTGDDSATSVTTTTGMTPTTGMTTTTSEGETDPPATGATSTGLEGTTMSPGDTTMTPGDTTAGTTGPAGTLCEEYAGINADCYGKDYYDPYLEACVDYTAMLEGLAIDGCVPAYEDYLACLLALTCEEFMAEDACMAEFDDFGAICGLE